MFGDRVIARAGGTLLEHQPEETGSIEPMHRRPTVESLAHIGRNTLVTCDADEEWNEAMIAVADKHYLEAREKLSVAISQPTSNLALTTLMQRLLEILSSDGDAGGGKSDGQESLVDLGAYRQTPS